MINFLKIALPALVAVLLVSCNGNKLTPLELKKYVENAENGFVQTANSGPYHIQCVYTPSSYLTVQSFRSNNINNTEYHTRMAEFDKTDMYRLEISATDANAIAPLNEYFSFYMQENLSKVCGTDTFPCMVYHGEPYNAIDRKQHIAFGFENSSCMEAECILIQNSPLGPAPIRFLFDKNKLSTPPITLN